MFHDAILFKNDTVIPLYKRHPVQHEWSITPIRRKQNETISYTCSSEDMQFIQFMQEVVEITGVLDYELNCFLNLVTDKLIACVQLTLYDCGYTINTLSKAQVTALGCLFQYNFQVTYSIPISVEYTEEQISTILNPSKQQQELLHYFLNHYAADLQDSIDYHYRMEMMPNIIYKTMEIVEDLPDFMVPPHPDFYSTKFKEIFQLLLDLGTNNINTIREV